MLPDLHTLEARFLDASPEDLLLWASETFKERLAFASSFGAEDVCILEMIARLDLPIRVFTLDTGRLHQETYDTIDAIRLTYHLPVEIFSPHTPDLQAFTTQHGPNPFYDSIDLRKRCCAIRKIEPLQRALADTHAWITGLRASQSVTRAELALFERDAAHGDILKINPLARWSEEDVWARIRARSIPHNPLHQQGFPSIGCKPCTRAIEPGEDLRAGRWWWENPEHKECGLHVDPTPGTPS